MQTIETVVRRILADGSNPAGRRTGWKNWTVCPNWPPDVFAVVGTLAELSGLYAEAPFTSPWQRDFVFDDEYRRTVVDLGRQWAEKGTPPAGVGELWDQLLSYRNTRISDRSAATIAWKMPAMRLISIADEACEGIGFIPGEAALPNSPAVKLLEGHINLLKGQYPDLLYLPYSLCRMAVPDVVCVQPKTNTPRVGCTLRSVTHNLALLPPAGMVQTSWKFAHPMAESAGSLNLLLVPFPYRLEDDEFVACPEREGDSSRFFEIGQGWMRHCAGGAQEMTRFLSQLLETASRRHAVHGIVLPELALPKKCADEVALGLAKQPGLELFVTGTLESSFKGVRNCASTYRMSNGKVLQPISQSKHHRWCLNASQIETYELQDSLDRQRGSWWEQIEIEARSCAFEVLRHGASFAVLVCEDLARFDPVFPAIAAVGPNLVISLLMDGPQMKQRWSARYATTLADDPGSSVLTLTSLGMIRRSMGGRGPRHIALWKDPLGGYEELTLRPDHHALLISLSLHSTPQFALDGRTDHGAAKAFKLETWEGIKASETPTWLGLTSTDVVSKQSAMCLA